jgi:hypothetical protein
MNRMEEAFAEQLELRKLAGEIQEYQFEAVKLRLAKNTFYTCDFMALGDHVTFYEVKGFREDDAMVKIKVAAQLFPWFEFILVTRDRQGWKYTVIEPN